MLGGLGDLGGEKGANTVERRGRAGWVRLALLHGDLASRLVCRGGCRRDDVWWNVSYDERMDAGVAHDETNGLGDGGSRPRLLPTKV